MGFERERFTLYPILAGHMEVELLKCKVNAIQRKIIFIIDVQL